MKVIVDHIPTTTPYGRRTGKPIVPTTITVHNTANATSTARNERNWLINPGNTRTASFHLVVDDTEAIECIPLGEQALHAGSYDGNNTSIGIEICESGDYAKALDNAAELVADMLRERGWGLGRLRRHYDWSGKICPRKMYDGREWTGWEQFKAMVAVKLNPPAPPKPEPKEENVLNLSKYQRETLVSGLQKLLDRGVINDREWVDKAKNGTLTLSELAWLTFIVVANK